MALFYSCKVICLRQITDNLQQAPLDLSQKFGFFSIPKFVGKRNSAHAEEVELRKSLPRPPTASGTAEATVASRCRRALRGSQ